MKRIDTDTNKTWPSTSYGDGSPDNSLTHFTKGFIQGFTHIHNARCSKKTHASLHIVPMDKQDVS